MRQGLRKPLFITPGEPAGIGPELLVHLAQSASPTRALVAVADPKLLSDAARNLGLPLLLHDYPAVSHAQPLNAGELYCLPVALRAAAIPGLLNPANADYVLETLRIATDACLDGSAAGMVTGPVHKGVIADSGVPFTGHTEFLAARCGSPVPVMMLLAGSLRVALVTTHLPLREVADAITPSLLEHCIRVLHSELLGRFGVAQPRILVAGLNPHAGEGGHLGFEEIKVIIPVLQKLRAEGFQLIGPLPADTLFTPKLLEGADAVLAMFHDQGLPVLKHVGFGEAVNITLGLPILRTSVDHGVALDLAGKGVADVGSMRAALQLALDLADRQAL